MTGEAGTLQLEDGLCRINFNSEATLQAALVALAEAYGWAAEVETVIPGWGRLDLVLHATDSRDFAYVFEFKIELVKLSVIRKAFQQADGYSRWLSAQGNPSRVILAAPKVDFDLCNEVAYAYRDSVSLMDVSNAMSIIAGGWNVEPRVDRARARYADIARQQRVAMHAHNQLVDHRRKMELVTSERATAVGADDVPTAERLHGMPLTEWLAPAERKASVSA